MPALTAATRAARKREAVEPTAKILLLPGDWLQIAYLLAESRDDTAVQKARGIRHQVQQWVAHRPEREHKRFPLTATLRTWAHLEGVALEVVERKRPKRLGETNWINTTASLMSEVTRQLSPQMLGQLRAYYGCTERLNALAADRGEEREPETGDESHADGE